MLEALHTEASATACQVIAGWATQSRTAWISIVIRSSAKRLGGTSQAMASTARPKRNTAVYVHGFQPA